MYFLTTAIESASWRRSQILLSSVAGQLSCTDFSHVHHRVSSSLAQSKDDFASRNYPHAVFPASAGEEDLAHVTENDNAGDLLRSATIKWVIDGFACSDVKAKR